MTSLVSVKVYGIAVCILLLSVGQVQKATNAGKKRGIHSFLNGLIQIMCLKKAEEPHIKKGPSIKCANHPERNAKCEGMQGILVSDP